MKSFTKLVKYCYIKITGYKLLCLNKVIYLLQVRFETLLRILLPDFLQFLSKKCKNEENPSKNDNLPLKWLKPLIGSAKV